MKKYYLLTILLLTTFISCNTSDPKDTISVFVKYKTQPDKNIEALTALKTLVSKVEKEDHFIDLKIYVDPNDNSVIMLQEQWSDEAYYRGEHMKTKHIQQFMTESSSFLTAAPEISYYKLNSEY